MGRLTTDALVDAAFEAVFGGDQDKAKLRSLLADAAQQAAETMPRDLAARLRLSGPVELVNDGVAIRAHLPARGIVSVSLAVEGGSISLQIEAWRGRSAATITSCDLSGRYQAEIAIMALVRGWRRILLMAAVKG